MNIYYQTTPVHSLDFSEIISSLQRWRRLQVDSLHIHCGKYIEYALKLFDNSPKWNVVVLTCLIAGYEQLSRDIDTGRYFYGHMTSDCNDILATSILEMYAECGSLNIARDLFNKMPKRNIAALNCMIKGGVLIFKQRRSSLNGY
ncbi:hypothetical protein MTR_5g025940 [Medicago truncatula]|uniref:Pentatricopeptide n=1 Tax=Medicago truncatula TaxID=3880 RepID=G7K5C8_MEDTR|nr:hypothetical protein MTR_5g025940 [Medicago truncatula]